MPSFKAPLEDIQFILEEIIDFDQLKETEKYAHISSDLVKTVLEEAGKLCENEIFPLNQSGDQQGCHFKEGTVTTPKGFKEAYDQFVQGGWQALSCEEKWGGQEMPRLLDFILSEILCAANLSFSMYPMLTHGAFEAILKHGADDLKEAYLPYLSQGKWSGTMCLTEAHCGTDLRLLRTQGVPQEDGSYHITGSKIFISAGEHDLTENIIHLVIARTPNAPEGIKGISMFVVPKYLSEKGCIKERNTVECGSIEHKMGIKASSTCVMNFQNAKGWLIGPLHHGMECMFTMMNAARLGVGIQGLGLAEISYQNAVDYAKNRLQGRSLAGPTGRDVDPIIMHPDVRRMLLTMKSFIEGARALAYSVGLSIDLSDCLQESQAQEKADDYVQLLTPIIKAFLTDYAFEATNLGMQILGGHGYVAEYGMEQYVRDARIAQIYEGTNGIQALDLVGRKLGMHNGRYLRQFFHPVTEFIKQHSEGVMQEFVKPLKEKFDLLQKATMTIAQRGLKDKEEAGAAATDYLHLFGLVAIGYMWAQMAYKGIEKKGTQSAAFYQSKVETARFYIQRILPRAQYHFDALMAGKTSIMQLSEENF